MAGDPSALSRRDSLKAIAAGVGVVAGWPYLSERGVLAFVAIQQNQAPASPLVLTAREYAAVELLTEAIIPADDRSPGARAARVADYVDLLLSESEAPTRAEWSSGLAAFDTLARDRFGAGAHELSSDRAAALLTEMSRNEANPATALETFFALLKDATIRGYYTSEIGLRQELGDDGQLFLAKFAGCDHPEHQG